MPKSKKSNFLEGRDKIPYEELLSENHIICDIYFKDGEIYRTNGFDVSIATDKIFILKKVGKMVEKAVFPIFNILAVKQYYLELKQTSSQVEQEETGIAEELLEETIQEEGYIYLPGKKGRDLAKKQFEKAVKLKDRDIIHPKDLEVEEEEKKAVISAEELMGSVQNNE